MLRRILLASAGAMALTGAAFAAEPIPAPLPPPPPPFTWAGFYIGGTAGANETTTNISDLNGFSSIFGFGGSQSFSTTGFIGGGTAGYNWQDGSFVFGIETDFSGATNRASFTGPDLFDCDPGIGEFSGCGIEHTLSARLNWLGTTRGRLGLAVDRTLIYFTAGVAYAGVTTSFNTTGFCGAGGCDGDEAFFNLSRQSTRVGWTAGGGVEYAITPNWSVKGEALYANFQNRNFEFTPGFFGVLPVVPTGPFNFRVDNSLVLVRAGINYHFWTPPPVIAPVIAKY